MPRLRYKDGAGTGFELELKPGVNTLGRNSSNQLVIDDPSVSGCHCEIVVEGSSVRVKDLGSTNGTRLNGGAIQEASLLPGQIIQFGGVQMICEDPAPTPNGAPVAEPPKPRLSVNRSTQTAHMPAPPPSGSGPAAVPVPAPAPVQSSRGSGGGLLMGMDRAQLESQARAKMFWGEPVASVISFMCSYGLPREDAITITNAIAVERAAIVRKNGISRIVMGSVMTPVPVATFLTFKSMGFFDTKIFGASIVVGVIGIWKLIDGILMLFFPKSHRGDLSED